ncbi:MAG TPA: heavy metal translocating P-type ATPase [bacterium]|jgi:Cu2+-exporting ATPase
MSVIASSVSDGFTAVRVSCAHCGLPVPAARRSVSRDEQFCCTGCEAVWQILHECDLTEYYRLRDAYGEDSPRAAHISGKSFDYLDDPHFLARFASPRDKGGVRVEFYLEGVHCIACSWLVEKILLEREGARFARLDQGKATLEVIFDPLTVKLSRLATALDRIGYTPHAIAEDDLSSARKKETRRLLARMGIAGASAMNIMLLAISQYGGDYTGMDAGISALFRWVSFGLALPAVLYSAFPYYRGAWSGLRRRMLHMDLPISLGIVSAFLVSAVATFQNRGEVYYDSVCMLIFLLLAGRLLLQRAGRWASDAGERLLALTPRTVHVLTENGLQDTLLAEVGPGASLRILPGEIVPVDGTVQSASGWTRESHLTGEAAPVKHVQGELVYAGSVVEQSPLDICATAVGETTRLSRLAAMMQDAAQRRAPILSLMDRIAGYFVAGVLILAGLTALVWAFKDPSKILWNTAAMLVVACPCALGLATPVALAVAMGRAARRGIFIKGHDGVERLASVDHVILDKTGTLTEGRLSVVDARFAGGSTEAGILKAVAALEKLSGHAIATAFQEIETSDSRVEACHVHPGAGVEGDVDGVRYAVGSETFVRRHVPAIPAALSAFAAECAARALSVVWVARGSEVVAVLGLGDRIHSDARAAVERARSLNLELEILSGDQPQSVAHVAAELHISQCAGHVSPEQKLEHVENLLRQGHRVAMVGDGVNDAAALSRATVGISAAGSAEVARDAADVFISAHRGPAAIADALSLSRRAMSVIRLNLAIAVAYNLFGAALAITGHVGPLVAAILMPISSLTVLLIASRA